VASKFLNVDFLSHPNSKRKQQLINIDRGGETMYENTNYTYLKIYSE